MQIANSIVYYVLAMQERLKKMIELVQEECKKNKHKRTSAISIQGYEGLQLGRSVSPMNNINK